MGGGTCMRAELPLRANDFIEPKSGRYDEDLAKFSACLWPGDKNAPANLDNYDG